MIIKNKLDLIGNTPLVFLPYFSKKYNCNIYLKLEKYNLTYSSKDRVVKEILLNALKENKIKKGDTIIEATSGNTGISLACVCNILNLKCIIVMPKNVSDERIKLIKAYNGKIIFVDEKEKMKGAIKKANQLNKKIKNSYLLSQFNDINNVYSHFKTSNEIIDDLPEIDCFLCSYGTSGTIVGISQKLKEYKDKIKCLCCVPDNINHKVEGVYSNVKSKFHTLKYIDETIQISDVDVYKTQKMLTRYEGLFLGFSSALSFSGLIKYLKKSKVNNVVVFCPDGAERYLSNKYLIEEKISKATIIDDVNYIYNNLFSNSKFINDEVFFKYKISINEIINIKEKLLKDAKAIYSIDPSCISVNEVINSYVSFFAIFCYRIANYIYNNFSKQIARTISEYAHSKTSIDIHPDADIGEYFAIDHGSGIVIGQTCKIGNNVTLYHGVTLGAKSLKDKRNLVNKKRHPTILNNVTIYANSTILGGDVVIGNNCVIGVNKLIVKSIDDNTIVK